jgi:hypothetical protein
VVVDDATRSGGGRVFEKFTNRAGEAKGKIIVGHRLDFVQGKPFKALTFV